MTAFKQVPNASVVVHKKGRYTEVPLFYRGTRLYAQAGKEFVRLEPDGRTSEGYTRWDSIEGYEYQRDKFGHPEVKLATI